MVYLGTHHTGAMLLEDQSTKEIWKSIQGMWNLVYVVPPYVLQDDEGTSYISKEMRSILPASGVTLKEAPVESPSTTGHVERCHGPFRAAYNGIRRDLDRDCRDVLCLKFSVTENITVGYEVLCPMLLVFGSLPQPTRSFISMDQITWAATLELDRDEYAK